MADSTPQTSTSRVSLKVAAALEDLYVAAVDGGGMSRDRFLDAMVTVMHDAKPLREYQVDEVVDHVRERTAPRDVEDGPTEGPSRPEWADEPMDGTPPRDVPDHALVDA